MSTQDIIYAHEVEKHQEALWKLRNMALQDEWLPKASRDFLQWQLLAVIETLRCTANRLKS